MRRRLRRERSALEVAQSCGEGRRSSDSSERYLTFYTVEQVKGDRVRLSTGGRECYARSLGPRPIDQAIAYFTDRINRIRHDVFSYLMRSMVEADQRQPDKARADLNEAIKVDPKDAAARVAQREFLPFDR